MFCSNNKNKYKDLIIKYKKEIKTNLNKADKKMCSFYDYLSFIFFGYIPYFLLNPFMKVWKRITGRV